MPRSLLFAMILTFFAAFSVAGHLQRIGSLLAQLSC